MAEIKRGQQSPTRSVILPYDETKGQEAVELYNASGNTCQPWQEEQLRNILAQNEDGLWIHAKYGYAVPRRNGKGEILIMRELWGLCNGEKVLHTAHLSSTSSSASYRLAECLDHMGYTEVIRMKKDESYDKHYVFHKQFGLERIELLGEGGGEVRFRTRTSRGGLGEGFDLLVIDEAQEYQDDQESSLKYVVSDSSNPQTIFTGTPPTAVSAGTKFLKYRDNCLAGKEEDAGWAEWSVDAETDPYDVDAWYRTNPSLGLVLTERKIRAEIGEDKVDFNIQRLGLWYSENLQSAISENEWKALLEPSPRFKDHRLFAAVKFGKDAQNASLSIATRLADDSVFVEVIDSRPMKEGVGWILDWVRSARSLTKIAVDGFAGQMLLEQAMKQERLLRPVIPSGRDFFAANTLFEQAVFAQTVHHSGQQPLIDVVSHTEKNVSQKGGFSYRAQIAELDISILDSVILAHWLCADDKGEIKQRIRD